MAICVDREKCIGCESCIAVCPVGALNMVDGKANIDQDVYKRQALFPSLAFNLLFLVPGVLWSLYKNKDRRV